MEPREPKPQSEPEKSTPTPAVPRPVVRGPVAHRPSPSQPPSGVAGNRSEVSEAGASVEPRVLPASLARWGNRLGALALALAVGITLFGGPGPESEERHINFSKHIQPLEEANAASSDRMVRKVTRTGRWTHQKEVEVGSPLREQTEQIRDLLVSPDRAEAQAHFAGLQSVPDLDTMPDVPGQPNSVQAPTLTPGMQADLLSGEADLFRLYLYDNCAEDGDIVDVYIDGARFCTVPITHAGSTLTVPVKRGTTHVVELRGIYDGGGGITVAFRSSEGDYFTERMAVGQAQTVALVAR